jgi:hypothetical protein
VKLLELVGRVARSAPGFSTAPQGFRCVVKAEVPPDLPGSANRSTSKKW